MKSTFECNKSADHAKAITFGKAQGDYYPFCIEAQYPIRLHNKSWPTVAHYVQAQRFAGLQEEELIRGAASFEEVMIIVKRAEGHLPDGHKFIDNDDLKRANKAKFSQHLDLGQLLISTEDASLIYASDDLELGVDARGNGCNLLGMILMSVRRCIGHNRYLNETTEKERLERHLEQFPNDVPATLDLVSICRQEERQLEARELINRALEIKPDLSLAHYALGLTLSEQEEYEGAHAQFQMARGCRQSHEAELYPMALMCLIERRNQDALMMIELDIESGNRTYESFTDLACVAAESGEMDQLMKRALNEAQLLEPRHLDDLMARFALFFETRLEKATIIVLEEVIRNYPGYLDAYRLLVVEYAKQEKFEEALEVACRLIKENANYVDGHLIAGVTCLKMEYDDLAHTHFRQALWLEPDNLIALEHMRGICTRLGRDFDKTALKKARKLHSEQIRSQGMDGLD